VPALKTHRRYLSSLFAVLLLGAGCDGGSDPPSEGAPPGSSYLPVRGNERIAWSQPIESGSVNGYQFVALIDDNQAALSDVQCTGGGSSAECSAPLPRMTPGRHRFQLVAINTQGVQSAPSEPLFLDVGAGQTAPVELTAPSISCSTCTNVETLASGLGRVERLTRLSNGDLLMLHEGSQLLRWRGGVVVEAARVDASRDPMTRWVDFEIHPGFPDTPFVYALALTERADGSRTTAVIRMRAVGDAFVEQVTVVPPIPVNSLALPELAIGSDALLYLAIPQTDEGMRADAYDGMLLRFTGDGLAAGNDAGTSPVLAHGVARPGAMSWDVRRRLWLLEREEDSQRTSAFLAPGTTTDTWPRRLNQVVWSSLRPTLVSGLVFVDDSDSSRAFLTAGQPGALLDADVALDSGTLSDPRVVLGGISTFNVTAVAAGECGQLFVAGSTGAGRSTSVLRVTLASQQ